MSKVPVVACLLGAVGIAACGDSDDGRSRVAVQWQSIELSADRRTITVVEGYPIGTEGCGAEPAGIDVATDLENASVEVTVWMRINELPDDAVCSAICELSEQSVTLDRPLPTDVELVPAEGAVQTCGPAATGSQADPPETTA